MMEQSTRDELQNLLTRMLQEFISIQINENDSADWRDRIFNAVEKGSYDPKTRNAYNAVYQKISQKGKDGFSIEDLDITVISALFKDAHLDDCQVGNSFYKQLTKLRQQKNDLISHNTSFEATELAMKELSCILAVSEFLDYLKNNGFEGKKQHEFLIEYTNKRDLLRQRIFTEIGAEVINIEENTIGANEYKKASEMLGQKNPKLVESGIKRLKKLVDAGIGDAAMCLGEYYSCENGNLPEAEKWFNRAAEMGIKVAYKKLGRLFYDRTGGNITKAIFYLEKIEEDGEACGILGDIYLKGIDPIMRNARRALGYYMQACDQGYYLSRYRMGMMYEEGIAIEKNVQKANACYQLLLSQLQNLENPSAIDFRFLGNLYHNGKGVEKNDEIALSFYKKAADAGDQYAKRFLEQHIEAINNT